VDPQNPMYGDVDRAVTKYPFDPRRLDQLLTEVGMRRDRDGFFAAPTGERFQPTLWVTFSTQLERQLAIMTDTWRQAGIDFQPYVIPCAQARDNQFRSTFPGLLGYGVSPSTVSALETFTIDQIGTAANRWGGQNRGGWASPEYDRLLVAYHSTLEPTARNGHAVQMLKLLSDEVLNYPVFRDLGTIPSLSSLKGPRPQVPEALAHWNIHEWELG